MAKRLRPKRLSKQVLERKKRHPTPSIQKDAQRYEAEVLEGLVPFAVRELAEVGGLHVTSQDATSVQFRFSGPPQALRKLRKVVAVYRLESFPIPRPRALLGHEHLTKLLGVIEEVKKQDGFLSFRIGAAGSDSAVFTRLAQEVEKSAGLRFDAEAGDLLLRVRKSKGGWEILFRMSARPLSSRFWRVCNLAGGLNATLAAAIVDLVGANPQDRFFNAMCGSGTLLIERGLSGSAARLVGCDISRQALECSEANVRASHLPDTELLQADAASLPFADASFDVIVADVPWGDAVGTHKGNAALYPAFLKEAARIARSGARLAVLTHEIKLFERILGEFRYAWQLRDEVRVFHGGHYPHIYVLTRT